MLELDRTASEGHNEGKGMEMFKGMGCGGYALKASEGRAGSEDERMMGDI